MLCLFFRFTLRCVFFLWERAVYETSPLQYNVFSVVTSVFRFTTSVFIFSLWTASFRQVSSLQRLQGRFAKANPTDTLELLQIVRAKQDALLLDFYAQALTDTADTYTRSKISVQDKDHGDKRILNEKCLICKKVPETIEHMFCCPVIQQTYAEPFAEITSSVDPLSSMTGTYNGHNNTGKIKTG